MRSRRRAGLREQASCRDIDTHPDPERGGSRHARAARKGKTRLSPPRCDSLRSRGFARIQVLISRGSLIHWSPKRPESRRHELQRFTLVLHTGHTSPQPARRPAVSRQTLSPRWRSFDVAFLARRPKGAATSQPRATPWDRTDHLRSSPERARQGDSRVPPFQGFRHVRIPIPRALPWAFLCGPFGANEAARDSRPFAGSGRGRGAVAEPHD